MNSPYRQAPAAEEGLCDCRFSLGHSVCKRCHRQIPFGRRDGLFRVVLHTVMCAELLAYFLVRIHLRGSHHPTECYGGCFLVGIGYVLSSVLLKKGYERYLGERVPEPLDTR